MSNPVSFGGARPLFSQGQVQSLSNWDTISSPVDGQVLTYDATIGKWKPTNVSESGMGAFTGSTITDNSTTKQSLQALETSIEAPNGGTAVVIRPVVTANDGSNTPQGTATERQQSIDYVRPDTVWYFYGYTGTGQHNQTSKTGMLRLNENVPGVYSLKVRAAWPFGTSDEKTINVYYQALSLSRDLMFGGVGGLQTRLDWDTDLRSQSYHNIAIEGAVVDNAGTYTWDDGTIVADSANCVGFWDYKNKILIAFRYNSSGTLENSHVFDGASVQPIEGVTFANGGNQFTANGAINTALNGYSVLDKRLAMGIIHDVGVGGKYYLQITPSGSEFDNFGSSGTDWSYGFVLKDDWISSVTGCQMLAPGNAPDAFVSGIAAYDLDGSDREWVLYGNTTSGPYWSQTNAASWTISGANYLIGSVGDLVVVTFDGASKAWKVYVEGVLIYNSQNVKNYMQATTTPTSLRLGDISLFDIAYYEWASLTGWYPRLDNIFVANGTEFSQAQVTEMTVDKADLTLSDNYGDFTTYATFTSGITSVKGSATYTRGSHDSRLNVEFPPGSNFL